MRPLSLFNADASLMHSKSFRVALSDVQVQTRTNTLEKLRQLAVSFELPFELHASALVCTGRGEWGPALCPHDNLQHALRVDGELSIKFDGDMSSELLVWYRCILDKIVRPSPAKERRQIAAATLSMHSFENFTPTAPPWHCQSGSVRLVCNNVHSWTHSTER